MSKKSVNRGPTNGAVGTEIKFAGNDNKDKMYEPKHKRKLVRVFTVVAYVFSVSLAAIMLSLFYMFIYNPGKSAGDGNKGRAITDSDTFVVQRNFIRKSNQDILNFINNTYSSPEREEPRALPLKESQFENRNQPSKPARGDELQSPGSKIFIGSVQNENETSLQKIIKYLKPA